MKKSEKDRLAEEARQHLLRMLKPGDVVWCVLRKVAYTGMSRQIDFYAIQDNEPLWLTGRIARLLDYRQGKNDALMVSGCGMDMGFHVVYSLGSALWPDGTPQPHGTRNGEADSAGGYALRHRWL